jgi:HEAT repeat protein
MKTWRIHLVWALVTVVSSAAWSQRAVRAREVEFLEREKVLQVRIVEAKKAAPPVAANPLPVLPAPTALPAAIPEPAAPHEYEYEVISEDRPTVEALRMLMKEGKDVWRAYQVIQRMVKSPLKTQLLRELFESKEPQVRRAVLYMLHESLGAEAAGPLLQECLRTDPASEVREVAAQQLGYQEAPGNIEALLQAFQKDELKVQVACASALVERGQSGPAAQLVPRFAALLDSPDGALRRQAVASLGQLRCPQAMPYLTRALRDTNGDVRLEAVNSLWNTQDPAIATLVEPLVNDPIEEVRDTVKSFLQDVKAAKE